MEKVNLTELEFLKESNSIEREYSSISLIDSVEAWNYAKNLKKINNKTILNIHKKLMKNLNPRIAGKMRNVNVMVGGRICLSPKKIKKHLEALCKVIPKNEEDIKQWHITFEAIHPFEDGNGRTGRIIMNLQRIMVKLPLLIIHEGPEQFEYYKWFKEK